MSTEYRVHTSSVCPPPPPPHTHTHTCTLNALATTTNLRECYPRVYICTPHTMTLDAAGVWQTAIHPCSLQFVAAHVALPRLSQPPTFNRAACKPTQSMLPWIATNAMALATALAQLRAAQAASSSRARGTAVAAAVATTATKAATATAKATAAASLPVEVGGRARDRSKGAAVKGRGRGATKGEAFSSVAAMLMLATITGAAAVKGGHRRASTTALRHPHRTHATFRGVLMTSGSWGTAMWETGPWATTTATVPRRPPRTHATSRAAMVESRAAMVAMMAMGRATSASKSAHLLLS